MTSSLYVDITGHMATCTLTRPEKHNSLNKTLINQLQKTITQLDNDPNIALIVLTAEGPTFCAGADLQDMKDALYASPVDNQVDALQLDQCLNTLWHTQTPTLAIVQGNAYGGGCGLICCCDMVIAADTATFCFSEVTLGLIPAMISPYVIHTLGASAARYYFLSAQPFDAIRAQHLGMIHQVVKPEQLAEASETLQQKILNTPTHALTACKEQINSITSLHPNAKTSSERIATLRMTKETQQLLKQFLENKK